LRQKAVRAQQQAEQVLFVKSFLVPFCDDKKGWKKEMRDKT
jgi:hypothetical protein